MESEKRSRVEQLPRILGRYRLDAVLGAGGMGVVYRAVDLPSGQPVAVKLLLSLAAGPEAVTRFIREVKFTAQLEHENIIQVLDLGRTPADEPYCVMELLDGEALNSVLKRERPLTAVRTVHIVTQVCEALHLAHQRGIVHRDIKPSNLMLLQREGQPDFVKVLDFGIAKSLDNETALTGTGLLVGTLRYVAPEQILGRPSDGRSDLYAVGVVLFEMLTGTLLFPEARDTAAILFHQVHTNPVPPAERAPQANIPAALSRVVKRCLAKDPDERFPDMLQLAAALREAVASVGTAAADVDLDEIPFRQCAQCRRDSSRFATRCGDCGAELRTPEQDAYMRQLIRERRAAETAAPLVVPSTPVDLPAASSDGPAPASSAGNPLESLVAFFDQFSDDTLKRVVFYAVVALVVLRLLGVVDTEMVIVLTVGLAVGALGLWARRRDD